MIYNFSNILHHFFRDSPPSLPIPQIKTTTAAAGICPALFAEDWKYLSLVIPVGRRSGGHSLQDLSLSLPLSNHAAQLAGDRVNYTRQACLSPSPLFFSLAHTRQFARTRTRTAPPFILSCETCRFPFPFYQNSICVQRLRNKILEK